MTRRPVDPVVSSATFREFRKPDARARRGPIRVAFVSTGGHLDRPQVAFAVSKRCGGAVERNRIRRRLRAALAQVTPPIERGAYLIGTDPEVADLSFDQLIHILTGALAQAGGTRSTEQ